METVVPPELNTLVEPPRKPRVKLLITLVIVLLIAGAGALFIRNLNTPATGVITTSRPTSKATNPPILVRGKTVTFMYGAALKRATPSPLATGDVEKFSFIKPNQPSWSLAIQVKRLPSGNLADDSNYNLRKQNPQQYSEQKQTINGQDVSVMLDQSGTHNKVAFIAHDQLVGEVALSGSNDDAQSQQIFTDLLQSWHWL